MSTDKNYDEYWGIDSRQETKKEKIERKCLFPFEFYASVGSSFFLYPTFTFNKGNEFFAFDFLWFHIGILKLND